MQQEKATRYEQARLHHDPLTNRSVAFLLLQGFDDAGRIGYTLALMGA